MNVFDVYLYKVSGMLYSFEIFATYLRLLENAFKNQL